MPLDTTLNVINVRASYRLPSTGTLTRQIIVINYDVTDNNRLYSAKLFHIINGGYISVDSTNGFVANSGEFTTALNTRLAPGVTKTYYIEAYGHPLSSGLYSDYVPIVFTMPVIVNNPIITYNPTNVTRIYDTITHKSTYTWTDNAPSTSFKYRAVNTTNNKTIFENVRSTGINVTYELDDRALIDDVSGEDNIMLQGVDTTNANIYSADVAVFRGPNSCLLKGTLVKTQDSYVPIEELNVDDVVLNHKHEPTKITKTINQVIYYKPILVGKEINRTIYKIPAGEYGATKDIFLTHHHRFLANGKMLKPLEAGLEKAKPEEFCDEDKKYTVYHLRLEDEYNNHFIVNGDCVVEDWYDWPGPRLN